jgi:hypothetical protein
VAKDLVSGSFQTRKAPQANDVAFCSSLYAATAAYHPAVPSSIPTFLSKLFIVVAVLRIVVALDAAVLKCSIICVIHVEGSR